MHIAICCEISVFYLHKSSLENKRLELSRVLLQMNEEGSETTHKNTNPAGDI